jgi:KDO2-lipid IV(A) lauroyltransferase
MDTRQPGQSDFFSWYHRSIIVKFLLFMLPWFMRTFSRRALHVIRYPFTFLYYFGGTSYRRAVRGNLRVALGRSVSEREVKRITRRVFSNVTKSFADMFFVAALSEKRWPEVVAPPVGKEKIGEALQGGKGVIILTGHIGNWEIGGITLAGSTRSAHMVYMPDRFAAFERARRKARVERHVVGIPMGTSFDTALTVIRLLKQNKIVTMKGDRALNGQGIVVPFFGRETVFPKGPFLIAYITGAPILPVFVVLNKDDRYIPIVEDPISITRTDDRERDVKTLACRVGVVIETYIRMYPDQWYMFYPFWKGEGK